MSNSAHFMAQISAKAFRSRRRSTSLARLSGDLSARKARYSSSVGSVPVMSIVDPPQE